MFDSFGRSVEYLRLSVTARCAAGCIYCRGLSADLSPDQPQLSLDEIENLVRFMVDRLDFRKVRLTGGEPTARHDLPEMLRRLAGIRGLGQLVMTTNGLSLAHQAKDLKAAGLHRVNVSLDSLNRENYTRITGIDALPEVLAGIDAALACGLVPVKINTVIIGGVNDQEIGELLLFAAERGLEIRFIELMPTGPLARLWWRRFVPENEIRRCLDHLVTSWRPGLPDSGPARRFRAGLPLGRWASVGFISPMSCPFCRTCNRLRIAADGTIYPCLMDGPAGSVLPALRPAFDQDRLEQILCAAIRAKPREHPPVGCGVMACLGG